MVFVWILFLIPVFSLHLQVSHVFSNGDKMLLWFQNSFEKDQRMCIDTAIPEDQNYWVKFLQWPQWDSPSYNCLFKVNDWAYANKYLQVNVYDKNGRSLVLVSGNSTIIDKEGWFQARFVPRSAIHYKSGYISQFIIKEGTNQTILSSQTGAILIAMNGQKESLGWWVTKQYFDKYKQPYWISKFRPTRIIR